MIFYESWGEEKKIKGERNKEIVWIKHFLFDVAINAELEKGTIIYIRKKKQK